MPTLNHEPASPRVPLKRDAITAFVLSAAFGLAAGATVPLIIGSLPPEARKLPLPLPAFSLILALQMTAIYGLLGLAGLRLARARGLDPTPFLPGGTPAPILRRHAVAFGLGLGCGGLLAAVVAAIQQWAPGTLPTVLHPPSFGAALAASVAGSIGEEILFRLFFLSLLLRLLPRRTWALVAAIAATSLAFAAAHAPAFVFLYGGFQNIPHVSWLWLVGLNGLLGAAFALIYLRSGVLAAILAHFGTDLVWHVTSHLTPAP